MPSKQEILDEIKRTAQANGGKPLGTRRFEQEAGIKPYDWERYWSRFGDAQAEAGFDANQLQGAHSDNFLIEKLTRLTRKLGRIPTYREIEVERRTDAELPSKKVFERLGGKSKLVLMVANYCTDRAGFEDVAALCRPTLKGIPAAAQASRSDLEPTFSEVYLFKSGRYYKIGRTNDTVRRGNEVRIQLPEKITLVHSIKTDDPAGVEAYWHRRYKSKRMNGEWFDLSPADIKAFKRWRLIA